MIRSQSRNTQLIRWVELICRMLDGRAKRMEDFADIHGGLSPKTRLRDLQGLAQVPRLNIVEYEREGVRFWRMDGWLIASRNDKPKTCSKCGEKRPLDEFPKDPNRRDGRRGTCNDCSNEIHRDWVAKNRERLNASNRRWHARNKARINRERREKYDR